MKTNAGVQLDVKESETDQRSFEETVSLRTGIKECCRASSGSNLRPAETSFFEPVFYGPKEQKGRYPSGHGEMQMRPTWHECFIELLPLSGNPEYSS